MRSKVFKIVWFLLDFENFRKLKRLVMGTIGEWTFTFLLSIYLFFFFFQKKGLS